MKEVLSDHFISEKSSNLIKQYYSLLVRWPYYLRVGGGMGGFQLKVGEGSLLCLTCICMGLRFCGLKQQERLVCSPPLHPENLYLERE